MTCSRCKVDLVFKTYENVSVENCEKCGAIWLDAGKLEPILKAHDVNFAPALIEKTLREGHAGIPKAELDTTLPCPKCSRPMNAMNYDYSSGVIIHVCPSGQGLWFDKDQLAEVQIFMEHWDHEEQKNNQKWSAMARQARQEESAELDREDAEIRKNEPAILRTIDAVLHQFQKLGRNG